MFAVTGCYRYRYRYLLLIYSFVLVHTGAAGGRLFATLLGYPGTCTRNHISHTCTLSLACWLAGGSSEAGCGASPWLVACCVTGVVRDSGSTPTNNNVGTTSSNNILPASMMTTVALKKDKIKDLLINRPIGSEINSIQSYGGFVDAIVPKERISLLQRRADADASSNELTSECGVSADRILHKRIIGGTEARFAQFPWQAHIRIAAYQCGGVLVSRSYVATAAHCIVRARLADITVHLGELDTQDTGQVLELAPAERHRVRRRLVHPLFRFRITQPDRYDLALLQLSATAGRMFHISPVCLPHSGMQLHGRSGVVAGWGKIKPSTELTGTNVLRSAIVPILDSNECVAWHNTRQISVELHEDMVCAGHADGSRDACLGDSGGPLIVLERGRWTLVGITSAGFGCGEPRQPGIYHNVALTAGWIRSVIH